MIWRVFLLHLGHDAVELGQLIGRRQLFPQLCIRAYIHAAREMTLGMQIPVPSWKTWYLHMMEQLEEMAAYIGAGTGIQIHKFQVLVGHLPDGRRDALKDGRIM